MESGGGQEEATGENPGFLMFFRKLMLTQPLIHSKDMYWVLSCAAYCDWDTKMEKTDVVSAPVGLINKQYEYAKRSWEVAGKGKQKGPFLGVYCPLNLIKTIKDTVIILGSILEKEYMCAKSLQSCSTICDHIDCSLPGSSVHGILQVRILE